MIWLRDMLDPGDDLSAVAGSARSATICGWVLFAALILGRIALGPL